MVEQRQVRRPGRVPGRRSSHRRGPSGDDLRPGLCVRRHAGHRLHGARAQRSWRGAGQLGDSLLIKVNGCFSADEDFDGQSYQRDWLGTNPNVKVDRRFHPEPVRFTSATTRGHDYPRIAFETDLPRIEAADAQDNPPFCDRTTGANCVNPPAGAKFYPFYTTANLAGTCVWQQGGNYIPGTTRHFGGSSKAEYGPLLRTVYPAAGFTTVLRYNNFNSGDRRNPCPVR
jgi:hypothetical protein